MMKYVIGILVLALVIGCSKKEVLITPGSTTTVSESGGSKTTEVNTDQGSVKFEENKDDGSTKITGVNEKGDKTTLESQTKFDLAEMGVDIYPGAKASEDQNAMSKLKTDGKTVYSANLISSDTVDKIEEFYKKALKEPSSFSSQGTAIISGKTASGDEVHVTASYQKDKGVSLITLLVSKTTN